MEIGIWVVEGLLTILGALLLVGIVATVLNCCNTDKGN